MVVIPAHHKDILHARESLLLTNVLLVCTILHESSRHDARIAPRATAAYHVEALLTHATTEVHHVFFWEELYTSPKR